jgi:hypothetical protein
MYVHPSCAIEHKKAPDGDLYTIFYRDEAFEESTFSFYLVI